MNISNGRHGSQRILIEFLRRLVLPWFAPKPPRAERLPDATDLSSHLQRDIGIAEQENELCR